MLRAEMEPVRRAIPRFENWGSWHGVGQHCVPAATYLATRNWQGCNAPTNRGQHEHSAPLLGLRGPLFLETFQV